MRLLLGAKGATCFLTAGPVVAGECKGFAFIFIFLGRGGGRGEREQKPQ